MSKVLCIMLVAAEASGDALGAGLMRALRRRLGEGVRFVGVGGARMEAEGLVSPFDISDLSILGWAEDRVERALATYVDQEAIVLALARRTEQNEKRPQTSGKSPENP